LGTWGAGPFENDTAADLVGTLAELTGRKRAAQIDELLGDVLAATEPLDADVATEALAAVGVVVASVVPDAGLLEDDDLADVTVAVDEARWVAAGRVVTHLKEQPSELADLWDEAGAADELAATLQALSDALAEPLPSVGVRRRLRRAVSSGRRGRREEKSARDDARRPDSIYVAAGPGQTAFALAVARGGELTRFTLVPLAPSDLPLPFTLTMESGSSSMTTVAPFSTDELPLYDGGTHCVQAALMRPGNVPVELADWIAATVNNCDGIGEQLPRWPEDATS